MNIDETRAKSLARRLQKAFDGAAAIHLDHTAVLDSIGAGAGQSSWKDARKAMRGASIPFDEGKAADHLSSTRGIPRHLAETVIRGSMPRPSDHQAGEASARILKGPMGRRVGADVLADKAGALAMSASLRAVIEDVLEELPVACVTADVTGWAESPGVSHVLDNRSDDILPALAIIAAIQWSKGQLLVARGILAKPYGLATACATAFADAIARLDVNMACDALQGCARDMRPTIAGGIAVMMASCIIEHEEAGRSLDGGDMLPDIDVVREIPSTDDFLMPNWGRIWRRLDQPDLLDMRDRLGDAIMGRAWIKAVTIEEAREDLEILGGWASAEAMIDEEPDFEKDQIKEVWLLGYGVHVDAVSPIAAILHTRIADHIDATHLIEVTSIRGCEGRPEIAAAFAHLVAGQAADDLGIRTKQKEYDLLVENTTSSDDPTSVPLMDGLALVVATINAMTGSDIALFDDEGEVEIPDIEIPAELSEEDRHRIDLTTRLGRDPWGVALVIDRGEIVSAAPISDPANMKLPTRAQLEDEARREMEAIGQSVPEGDELWHHIVARDAIIRSDGLGGISAIEHVMRGSAIRVVAVSLDRHRETFNGMSHIQPEPGESAMDAALRTLAELPQIGHQHTFTPETPTLPIGRKHPDHAVSSIIRYHGGAAAVVHVSGAVGWTMIDPPTVEELELAHEGLIQTVGGMGGREGKPIEPERIPRIVIQLAAADACNRVQGSGPEHALEMALAQQDADGMVVLLDDRELLGATFVPRMDRDALVGAMKEAVAKILEDGPDIDLKGSDEDTLDYVPVTRGMPDPWSMPPPGVPYTASQVEEAMAMLLYGMDLTGTPFEHVQQGRW